LSVVLLYIEFIRVKNGAEYMIKETFDKFSALIRRAKAYCKRKFYESRIGCRRMTAEPGDEGI